MGCGGSKAVAVTTSAADFAAKPVAEKPSPKSSRSRRGSIKRPGYSVAKQDLEQADRRAAAPTPEVKPLVNNPSKHDAKMLLNDWSKPTEDRAHARIMSKSPGVFDSSPASAPSKSRAGAAGAADDDADSSDDEGGGVRKRTVHKDGYNNVVDHAMPGAVQEESLIAMFRPKSAIRLDLD